MTQPELGEPIFAAEDKLIYLNTVTIDGTVHVFASAPLLRIGFTAKGPELTPDLIFEAVTPLIPALHLNMETAMPRLAKNIVAYIRKQEVQGKLTAGAAYKAIYGSCSVRRGDLH